LVKRFRKWKNITAGFYANINSNENQIVLRVAASLKALNMWQIEQVPCGKTKHIMQVIITVFHRMLLCLF
jgi:hypothetical protein